MSAKVKGTKDYPAIVGLIIACMSPFLLSFIYDNGRDYLSYIAINLDSSTYEVVETLIELFVTIFLVKMFVPLIRGDKTPPRINNIFRAFSIGCLFLFISKFASEAGYLTYKYLMDVNQPIGTLKLPENPALLQNPKVFSFVVIFIGPIIEELWFRHIIYNKLRPFLAISPAILISSILFTLNHYPNYSGYLVFSKFFLLTAPFVFVIGLLLGIIRVQFSIWHAIFLHTLINAYGFIQTVYVPLGLLIALCMLFGIYFLWIELKIKDLNVKNDFII